MEIKIGILMPKSDMYPKLALDFLNGFKVSFSESNAHHYIPKLIFDSIGTATEKNVLQKVEKMMLLDETDVIISFCSYFMLEELVGIVNAYKKPFIHVSLGARMIKENHYSPFVLHHSLNLCHSAYLSGNYAANTFGKKAAILVSYYDGGYHMAEAFFKGFTEAGGEIVYNYVSPMDYKSESFETMIAGITAFQPDVLFTLFSYKEANMVFEALSNSGINQIPIMAGPIMTDETTLAGDFELDKVFSIASWAFLENLNAMRDFSGEYDNQFSEPPNIISLLGVECGLILLHALNNAKNAVPKNIGEFLNAHIIETPRGSIRFNPFNETVPDNFKLRHLKTATHPFPNTVAEVLDSPLFEKLNTDNNSFPLTGWRNPYTCT